MVVKIIFWSIRLYTSMISSLFNLESPQNCDFGGLCRIVVVDYNSWGRNLSHDATTTILLVVPLLASMFLSITHLASLMFLTMVSLVASMFLSAMPLMALMFLAIAPLVSFLAHNHGNQNQDFIEVRKEKYKL